MQTISLNKITQGQHGQYNAVDIGRFDSSGKITDLYIYAPEDGVVTVVDTVDDDSCGKRFKVKGATGEHGFCHNEEIYVKVGEQVKRGQKLAKMGFTGYTEPDNVVEGTHVHWVLYRGGQWVYPPSLVNQSFIKLEGGTMDPANEGDVINVYSRLLRRNPSQTDKTSWIGKPFKQLFYGIADSEEGKKVNFDLSLNQGDLTNYYRNVLGHDPNANDIEYHINQHHGIWKYMVEDSINRADFLPKVQANQIAELQKENAELKKQLESGGDFEKLPFETFKKKGS